jgi:hypothetical protein
LIFIVSECVSYEHLGMQLDEKEPRDFDELTAATVKDLEAARAAYKEISDELALRIKQIDDIQQVLLKWDAEIKTANGKRRKELEKNLPLVRNGLEDYVHRKVVLEIGGKRIAAGIEGLEKLLRRLIS